MATDAVIRKKLSEVEYIPEYKIYTALFEVERNGKTLEVKLSGVTEWEVASLEAGQEISLYM